ncbi:luciferin-binding protein-like [Liolophura sinensis]|uniref:luciferin-binding protein-like n=1 Tax=Liolophura sinensis TaxID=3198878 RepID=UPI0031594682
MADYISKKTGATEEEAARTRQEWVKWYHLLLLDPSKKLDLEALLKGNRQLFVDNKEFYMEQDRTMASDIFDRLDFNKDGKICLEELNIFYEAVGVNDKALVKSVFEKLDKSGDGFIEREELVDDFIRHFSNPDPIDGQAYLISSVIDYI